MRDETGARPLAREQRSMPVMGQREAWRVLPFSVAPMGRQLALAEGMLAGLAASGVPALRWYVPAEPALVLGNGQSPAIVSVTACRERGVR
ncbi:MAG: hypothetical protein IVW57_15125, partial [Ktedonobacterales bacterium]|nr:hypothetical protein [Ktedonobacterales bacterium]